MTGHPQGKFLKIVSDLAPVLGSATKGHLPCNDTFSSILRGGRSSSEGACSTSDHWSLDRTHSGACFIINFTN